MQLKYFGDELIADSLTKLQRKRRSAPKDLKQAYKKHKERYLLYGQTSDDRVYFDPNSVEGFEMKIKVTSDNLSKQHGLRLWYLHIPAPEDAAMIFVPVILFDCRDEKNYPKRIATDILKKALMQITNGA